MTDGIERPGSFVLSIIVLIGGVLILDSATAHMFRFFTFHWERIDDGFFWGAALGTIVICLGIVFLFCSLLRLEGFTAKSEPEDTPVEPKG